MNGFALNEFPTLKVSQASHFEYLCIYIEEHLNKHIRILEDENIEVNIYAVDRLSWGKVTYERSVNKGQDNLR